MRSDIATLHAAVAATRNTESPLLVVPGCWDAMSALLVERSGLPAAFLTGGGLSMARFGWPDLGLVTASELIGSVAEIRDRISIPLIVDGDTGFGSPLNLARTVRHLERAGASAIQIEDQTFPKRCGHMAGKSVVPLAEAVGRVQAALDSREDMLVIARTDALAVEGFDSAVERADAFVAAGADMVFVEGPRSRVEMEAIARRYADRVPLIHNLVEGGVTPSRSHDELKAFGYAIALHPLILLHGFVQRAQQILAALPDTGEPAKSDGLTLHDMNRLLDAQGLIELGQRFAG